MSPPWKFKCFISERGENVVCDWYWNLSKKGRAKFDVQKNYLSAVDKRLWSRPHASPVGDGIYLIRFQDENSTQHRAAGYFIDKESAFLIAYPGIIEKDDTYKPTQQVYTDGVKQRRNSVGKSLCNFSRCCIQSNGGCAPCPNCSQVLDDESKRKNINH